MNGGSAIGGWRAAEAAEDAEGGGHGLPLQLEARSIVDGDEGGGPGGPAHLLPAAGAVLLVLAWVAGALWLAQDTLPLMQPPALIEFAASLAAFPLLLGVIWLLLRRSSRSEARGFARTAAAMRAEAAGLERTVATLSAAIDTNRIKLADQAEALATLGDHAAERLASVGRGFATEIAAADRHAAALSVATGEAQANLGVLLASLPRARAETLEAAELLDRVGRSADDHAVALDARLAALGDQAAAAERVSEGAAAHLADHVARVSAASDTAAARLRGATTSIADAVDALLQRADEGLDQAGRGLLRHGDAMADALAAHQVTLDGAARESADALAGRIEVIEIVAERVARRLEEQRGTGELLVGELEGGIGRVGAQLDRLHAQGVERSQHLAASITALGATAEAMTVALRTGDETATRAIGTAETLLTALDAAAREVDETLPDALGRLDARIAASQRVVHQAKPELLALVTAAESTHDAIAAIAQVIAEQRDALDALSASLLDTLATGQARADALGASVGDAATRAGGFADEAAPRLIEALLRVRETADAAAGKARETIGAVIPDAAARLGAASAAAMERAAAEAVEQRVAALSAAADKAVVAATQASNRLGERLRAIDDAAALVDTRLEDARAAREEGERDSFARRMSLLIEAMNSASIDITRSFAPDVADSAWAAYLKGDRGVFTRRAVRLLDAGEAREIGRLYDDQPPFRDQVNRYIHDFEAMLRAVLSQRDGSPLGVTLLSSDMGKLYVALAQAIERLR